MGLENFKKNRENLSRIASLPIDGERSKFEVEERRVKGYAIVWGSKNDYNEIVVKGATINSLNARGVDGSGKNKIVLLNQHRQNEPVGAIDVLREDDYGLYFEAEIIKGTRAADEALAQVKQGVLNQVSYGFNYVWDKTEYDSAEDAYILREIKLYEISLVTFGSDENAQLRSFNEFQTNVLLSKFSPEQLDELENILAIRNKMSRDEHSDKKEKQGQTNSNKLNFF